MTVKRKRGDPTTPKSERPKCGAKTRAGSCKAPAVWNRRNDEPRNGRCRMHGGLSTGLRTKKGRRYEGTRGGSRDDPRAVAIRPSAEPPSAKYPSNGWLMN